MYIHTDTHIHTCITQTFTHPSWQRHLFSFLKNIHSNRVCMHAHTHKHTPASTAAADSSR